MDTGINASLSSKLVQKLEFGELMKKDMATVHNAEFHKDPKFQYIKEMKGYPNLLKPIFEPQYK